MGVLGTGCSSSVTWTNVTVSAALANVTSTAGDYVGVFGVGSSYDVTWTNVTVTASLTNVASAAESSMGMLGAACYSSNVSWAYVTVAAVLSKVTSTAKDAVGVLGAGSYNGGVSWTKRGHLLRAHQRHIDRWQGRRGPRRRELRDVRRRSDDGCELDGRRRRARRLHARLPACGGVRRPWRLHRHAGRSNRISDDKWPHRLARRCGRRGGV